MTTLRDFLQLTGVIWWACVAVVGSLLGAVELRRRRERRAESNQSGPPAA